VSPTKKTKTAKTPRERPRRQNTLPEAVAEPSAAKLTGFAVNDRVSHPQFGNGAIIAIEGSTLSIAFDEQGTRRIVDSYVKRLKK
jgi:DNA helicase II / ATP-dependent DNA helicase PcrA